MRRWRGRRAGHPFFGGGPQSIAHRGGAKLAPENTMAAFSLALDDWDVDALEMDVRRSADGRLVVVHDATVDRTTDGAGAVDELPWSEIASLDAGHRFRDLAGAPSFRGRGARVPLLDEVLETFPRVRAIIEPKAADAARPLLRAVEAHGAAHRILIGAKLEATRRGARAHRGPWGASRRQVVRFWALHRVPVLRRAGVPAADAFQIPERSGLATLATRAFVRRAHEANMPVQVWTVDAAADMRRLLDMGVDGIQTDRPDVLARVLVERSGRPPPPALRRCGP